MNSHLSQYEFHCLYENTLRQIPSAVSVYPIAPSIAIPDSVDTLFQVFTVAGSSHPEIRQHPVYRDNLISFPAQLQIAAIVVVNPLLPKLV